MVYTHRQLASLAAQLAPVEPTMAISLNVNINTAEVSSLSTHTVI